MKSTKYHGWTKLMAVFFAFLLVLSMAGPAAYAASSTQEPEEGTDTAADADEEDADDEEDEEEWVPEAGSWEELVTGLGRIADEKEKGEEIVVTLTDDISAKENQDAISIEGGCNIILDLAGHTIDRGLADSSAKENGHVLEVKKGARLTLTDTSGKGSSITGGANTGNGGGVFLEDEAVLTVEQGIKIRKNRAKNGGGIFLGKDCELYLGSCTISDNDVTDAGGGIYGGQSHITFLGGLTKVKNNFKGGNDDNDLYMPADMEKLRFWTINPKKNKTIYSNGFEDGSRIGILLEVMTKVISEGYGQCNQEEAAIYFFYNGDGYSVSDDRKQPEVTIVKQEEALHDNTKTVVEIYKGDKLISSENCDSFYGAMDSAMNASGDEKVVILGGDYSSDEQIVIPKNKELIIDLNGHYIKRERNHETKRNGGVFKVEGGSTLTIRDSNPKKKGYDGVKGGVITGGASSNAGGGITVEEKGHLVMEGGTIYDCISDEDGGGVYVYTGNKETTFKMTGGRIYGCKTIDSADECYGGGIFFGDGLLDLSGGTIDNCYSEDDGGAIYCRRGEVVLNNMIFSGNKSANRGGAIYIGLDVGKYDGTLFTAIGCSFINNESMEDGGAFFMRDNPQHTGAILFDQCVFRGNKAEEDGGALVSFDDGMVLSNVEITGNTAGEYGGGVFVDSRYDINVKGVVVIRDNTCRKDSACSDLCLEDGTSTTAYVNSGGLARGSWIGIGSTSGKSIRLSKSMSTYEMKYFHAHKGTIGSKNVKVVEAKMAVTASIFASGRWISIVLIGGAGLIVLVVLIILKRGKGKSGLQSGGSI